jgi:hypothetical protein
MTMLWFSRRVQALLVSDFGPKISFRIVDTLRDEIRDGKLKSGSEIKVIDSGRWSRNEIGFVAKFFVRYFVSAGVAEKMHP